MRAQTPPVPDALTTVGGVAAACGSPIVKNSTSECAAGGRSVGTFIPNSSSSFVPGDAGVARLSVVGRYSYS